MVSAAAANLPCAASTSRSTRARRSTILLRKRAAVLQALLGVGKATGRAVILPRMLCYCDFMWKEMKACRVGGAESMRLPFDCPMDHTLDTPVWFEHSLGVSVREPNFLDNARVSQQLKASRRRWRCRGAQRRPGAAPPPTRRSSRSRTPSTASVASPTRARHLPRRDSGCCLPARALLHDGGLGQRPLLAVLLAAQAERQVLPVQGGASTRPSRSHVRCESVVVVFVFQIIQTPRM